LVKDYNKNDHLPNCDVIWYGGKIYKNFKGTCSSICMVSESSAMNMEAAGSFEALVSFRQNVQHHTTVRTSHFTKNYNLLVQR
jgi:hypothetical protein